MAMVTDVLRREPRLTAFYGVIALAFTVLTGQLWRLQIAGGEQYRQRADVNRIRVVTVKPPRGVIYDRAGRQVVRNVSSFTVSGGPWPSFRQSAWTWFQPPSGAVST